MEMTTLADLNFPIVRIFHIMLDSAGMGIINMAYEIDGPQARLQ